MTEEPGLLSARPWPPTLWPFRPKPQADELLSSYLNRIAGGMQIKPVTLISAMFGSDRALMGQDLDNYAPDHVVTALAAGVGIDRAAVDATTLRGLDGYLMGSYSVTGRKTWILPIDPKSNHRRRHGLQYCPACLASDRAPYMRRLWRLAFATACTRHGVELMAGCPACGAAVHSHRSPSLAHCFRCGTRLAGAGVTACPDLVAWQRDLEDTLGRGWCEMDGAPVWSNASFAIVRQIGALLVNGPHAATLRAATTAAFGGDGAAFDKVRRRQPIEYLEVEDRRRLFDLVRRLMMGWPSRFVRVCDDARVRRSHAIKDMPDPPFAYERVLRRHLDAAPYLATEEEVAAAASWLRRTEGRATYAALKEICGESRVAIYKHMDYVRRPSRPSKYREQAQASKDHGLWPRHGAA